MSIDGYLAGAMSRRLQLSIDADLDRVDAVRASWDAIPVGAATGRHDNPRLLVRSKARRAARTARGLPPSPITVTMTERAELDPCPGFFTPGDNEKLMDCASPRVVDARSRLGRLAVVENHGFRLILPSPERACRRLSQDVASPTTLRNRKAINTE
jgi:5-amino-6-(5-phosphoribosylamino)uracil reductase